MHKMLNDQQNAEEVYKLYAGSSIDRNKKLHEAIIDVDRVEAIQAYNSFVSQEILPMGNIETLSEKNNSGLWIFPSYFNHSCIANTKRMFLADIMLIYASRDLEQDEEITISYLGMENYSKRKEICEAFGFTCKCQLCQLDKKDEQLLNREAIVNKSKAEMYTGDLGKKLKIVERVKNTYKKRKDCQFSLMLPLGALARSYMEVLNFQEAIKIYTELFELFKDYDMDCSLFTLLSIAQVYAMLSQTKKAEEAVRRAYNYYVGGKDIFIYKCEHVFKFHDLSKFFNKL
jgi:tetratricopeptide (TPR) repeat protein